MCDNSRILCITAYCVKGDHSFRESNLKIRLKINQLNDNKINEKTYFIDKIYLHSKYFNLSYPGDLAILKFLNLNIKLIKFKSNNLKQLHLYETFDSHKDHLINVLQVRFGESICITYYVMVIKFLFF